MNLKHTIVFAKTFRSFNTEGVKFIVNQGGSRTSKTHSIIQLLIYLCLNEKIELAIFRKQLTSLKRTAMKDFINILDSLGVKYQLNKTDSVIKINGTKSTIYFIGTENSQKLRGNEWDITWVNEANEVSEDEFFEIRNRTRRKALIDFNPSDAFGWFYDLPPERSEYIISTIFDNPFLSETQRIELMSLKDKDPYLYDIFVLGKKGRSRENVYPEWQKLHEKPERFKEFAYGLDFGFQHPTALVKIWYHEDERFIEEVIYQSHLTSNDLVKLMNELGVDKKIPIAADHARPEMIQDLIRAGFAVYKADKSVKKGIDMVRRSKIYVHASAANVIRENANYKHKKINSLLVDNEVIKLHDDAMDAIRYGNTFISTFFT